MSCIQSLSFQKDLWTHCIWWQFTSTCRCHCLRLLRLADQTNIFVKKQIIVYNCCIISNMNMYPQNRHIFSLLALSLTWVATVCLIFITFFSTVWKVDTDYNADRSRCILQNINLFSSGKSSDTGKWQHYESNLPSRYVHTCVKETHCSLHL